jgi:hypothetical protein
MSITAELAADIWEREQEVAASEVLQEDMSNALDQELAILERSLGRTFVDSFYAGKTSCLDNEEADAWTEWYVKLNNGDGGVWSELPDRMQALYDAEECYFYDCYRLAVERKDISPSCEGEHHQGFA